MYLLTKILGKLTKLIYETRHTGLVEHDIMAQTQRITDIRAKRCKSCNTRQHFYASANNYAIEEMNLIIVNEYFI